jgi:hypothetical protein
MGARGPDHGRGALGFCTIAAIYRDILKLCEAYSLTAVNVIVFDPGISIKFVDVTFSCIFTVICQSESVAESIFSKFPFESNH